MRGVKTTEIVAGKYKRIASAHAPLSEEGRRRVQEQVDQMYATFVRDVAGYRSSTMDKVLSNMADGRVFMGAQAVAAGLADGVASLEEIVTDLARGRHRRRRIPSLAA